MMPVSRASSSSRSSSGLNRRSTENHAEPGTTLKPAPAPACPPTTSIEPAASSLSTGKLVRFSSRLVGQSGQRRRDPDHVLEGVHALVDVADVRLAAGRPHPQRDGASCGVPDHAAGRLGGQHRDGLGIDQAGVAQVSRAGGAAGLLVAHEVKDDPPPVEQAQRTRRRRPVEHRDEAALHVRGPTPDHLPVAAHGLELRGALGGDDVEVPVVVDDLRPVAHAPAHDRRIFQVPGRRELDQLRREVEPVERLAEHGRAAPQLAARRVLGGHAHERLEQRHHLLGAAVEPGLHIGAAIAQAVSVPN